MATKEPKKRLVQSLHLFHSERAPDVASAQMSCLAAAFFFGPYAVEGILSSVALDGYILHGWKLYPISLDKLSLSNETLVRKLAESQTAKISIRTSIKFHSGSISQPGFYEARYFIDPNDQIKDTFISFKGWSKGIAFVNSFNIGRFWPSLGPQCTLYVPAPILHYGENVVNFFTATLASQQIIQSKLLPNPHCRTDLQCLQAQY
ncbi:hypothetical protein M5K25_012990 [Dendrobium thyrsiflorum]|uniref:Beta-galactosidase galactose-binding domain-containing protein n=1 Tax=Dendrobium thyrsiflorum TaxID=117978 RepID=A0ABD0V5I6_DENTH